MTERHKKRIRQRFSRAAATYDAHADVQHQLVARLLEELPEGWRPARILELGCGTGSLTVGLAHHYPNAHIVAVDFAEGMLQRARGKLMDYDRVEFLCEDGERFLADCTTSFDLVCANAVLHWLDDPGAAVRRIRGLLATDGLFVGAAFGDRTFAELGQGMQRALVGETTILPSHRFPGREGLSAMLHGSFGAVALEELLMVREYDSLFAMLDHIRKTGVGGGQRGGGLLTRSRLATLDAWFRRTYGGYPATYQAFVFRCAP